MRISFKCKTNKDYCAINVAKFLLPTGSTLTVDRTRTEWEIDGEDLTMTWYCCYLHAIDNCNIFNDEAYITDASGFEDLVADARVMLLVEEDADEDYDVTVLDWTVGE